MKSDPDAAEELIASAGSEAASALNEVRELARGLHPAVLTDHGLRPALEALAARSPCPVELAAVPREQLPAPVETAAYYVVSESLANVAKYSRATVARVSVTRNNGLAVVEISDGVGGATIAGGSGLRGLADRVEALDGRLHLESPVGVGTRVIAEIPCAPDEPTSDAVPIDLGDGKEVVRFDGAAERCQSAAKALLRKRSQEAFRASPHESSDRRANPHE